MRGKNEKRKVGYRPFVGLREKLVSVCLICIIALKTQIINSLHGKHMYPPLSRIMCFTNKLALPALLHWLSPSRLGQAPHPYGSLGKTFIYSTTQLYIAMDKRVCQMCECTNTS